MAKAATAAKTAKEAKTTQDAKGGKDALESSFDEMLEEFRALGGAADNIRLGTGKIGRGIFPIDPAQPVRIRVPDNLLLKVGDLEFADGQLKVKKSAEVGARERAFFEEFQQRYSWGSGGEKDCRAFLASLEALPAPVREVLTRDFGLSHLFPADGDGDARVQRRFLRSRMISYKDTHVLMPIMELVNHGVRGSEVQTKDGIAIGGTFPEEALAHYGMVDPYSAFETWGFASPELIAFSLPLRMKLASHQLVVRRQLNNRKVRGNFRVPVLKQEDDKVEISYLMLGHAKFPRLAKGIFYQFMDDIGEKNAEEIFDRIRFINVEHFMKLAEVLDAYDGPLVKLLGRMCRYQVGAMAYAIGTRAV